MRWKKPLAAVGVAALLVAACGGSDDTTEDTSDENLDIGASGLAQDPTAEGPAPEMEGAQSGGTATLLSFAGFNTIDPAEIYYVNTNAVMSSLVTRTLTQYRWNEEVGDFELVPDLATDLGQHNADFTEWTFTLKDGIRYQDGTEVTAEDIKYGIERSMDRTQFPEGPEYGNQYFEGGLKYKGPYTGNGAECDCIQVDGNEITFTMEVPFPSLNYYLTFPISSPVPKGAADDPADYALNPLSTGPYMIEDYEPETSLTLVKNPEWDPNTDPGRHQYIDRWEMKFQEDSSALDQLLIADQGDAQTSFTIDNLLVPDYQKARQQAPDRIVEGKDDCQWYYYPDNRKITDPRVRKAMALAYPYRDAWLAGGEIVGVTRSAETQIVPRGTAGRGTGNLEYDAYGNGGIETDPEAARQLLEEADAVGFELKFLYASDDPASVDVKDVLVRAWEEAGFTANPQATTIAEISTIRADPNADINYRTGGWCDDWPLPDTWIPPLFQTDQYANYSYFSNKKIDKQIREIQAMPPEEQIKEWPVLEKEIMTKHVPLFSVGKGGVAMMRGSRIQGMIVDSANGGMPTFKDMWISQ
jgi:peptide/nickel transport system substrate-binding protein